jgi:hypothetical protein
VASTFASRLYAEIGYWMAGAVFALYRLQTTEYAEEADGVPAPQPQAADRIPLAASRLPTPA